MDAELRNLICGTLARCDQHRAALQDKVAENPKAALSSARFWWDNGADVLRTLPNGELAFMARIAALNVYGELLSLAEKQNA